MMRSQSQSHIKKGLGSPKFLCKILIDRSSSKFDSFDQVLIMLPESLIYSLNFDLFQKLQKLGTTLLSLMQGQ